MMQIFFANRKFGARRRADRSDSVIHSSAATASDPQVVRAHDGAAKDDELANLHGTSKRRLILTKLQK
jgi:hypothetical protein